MSRNSDPTGALLLGVGVGLWSFFKGFRILREYKVIADTPRMPIRSVPMGFVHIRGQAQSETILSSPVSHTPCCFYRVEIDQWRSSGKSSHSWQRVCTDMDGCQFHLADATGKVLVDAHAAEYDLPLATTRVVSSDNTAATPGPGTQGATDNDLLYYVRYAQMHSMTDKVGQWVDKRFQKAGAADNPEIQAKQQAVREFLAAVPEVARGGAPPVDMLARLAQASGLLPDPGKEQRRQMFLQHLQLMESMRQSGQIPMKVPVGQPASGRYRLCEYLVLPGHEYLIDGTCVENATDAADRTMIAKGQNEPTFLISAKSEQEVQHGLKKHAGLMILGGAALALACLAGLLLHWNLF